MDNFKNELESQEVAHYKKLEEMINGLSKEELLIISDAIARKNPYIMLESISNYIGTIETTLHKVRCVMEDAE